MKRQQRSRVFNLTSFELTLNHFKKGKKRKKRVAGRNTRLRKCRFLSKPPRRNEATSR